MAKKKEEANFEPPSSQVGLAERLERDNESRRKVSTAPGGRPQDEDDGQARDYGEDAGDPEYLGTDVMYQNHANDTEKPGRAEGDENPEQILEDAAYKAKEEGRLPGEPKVTPSDSSDDSSSSSSSHSPSTVKTTSSSSSTK